MNRFSKLGTFKRLTLAVLVSSLVGISAACSSFYKDKRFEASAQAKRYDFSGKIMAVDKTSRLLTVSHHEIKDFMPAMTMQFMLKEDWPLQVAAPGDEITATLVVDGPRTWLEDVVIKENTGAPVPASEGSGPVEAKPGDEVPDFRLTNQDGKEISIHRYRGKTLLMTFIYTRCPLPDYCTLMSNNFAQIDQQLQKEPALFNQTHLLSISFDPDYDTPQVLRSYGAAHTGKYTEETFAHWEFASGTKDEIKGLAQYFGLRYYEDSDQIIHGLRTVVIDPEGKVYKVYRGNEWKTDEVFDDLKALASAKNEK